MSSDLATESRPGPRRRRRKLNTPINFALAAILVAAVGFWVGGLVEGGADSSESGFPGGDGAIPSFDTGSTPAAGFSQESGSATSGEITSLSGNTLYVSTSDGNTVKVRVKGGATVTRNAETRADQLHPGDTVTVSGEADKAGVVEADTVSSTQAGVQTAVPAGLIPGAQTGTGAGSGD